MQTITQHQTDEAATVAQSASNTGELPPSVRKIDYEEYFSQAQDMLQASGDGDNDNGDSSGA